MRVDGQTVTERPTYPDGTEYPFNCCLSPDVRWRVWDGEEQAICDTCGYNWTDSLGVNDD